MASKTKKKVTKNPRSTKSGATPLADASWTASRWSEKPPMTEAPPVSTDRERHAVFGPDQPRDLPRDFPVDFIGQEPRRFDDQGRPLDQTVPRGQPRDPQQIAEYERNTRPATPSEERKFLEDFDNQRAMDEARAIDTGPMPRVPTPYGSAASDPRHPTNATGGRFPSIEQQVADEYFSGNMEAMDNAIAIAMESEASPDQVEARRVKAGDPIPPGVLEKAIKVEEARVASLINQEREKRARAERAKVDPSIKIMGEDSYSRYTNETEDWIARNRTQADSNVRPENRELWAIGQRQRRDRVEAVADGSNVGDMESLTLFEMWKQSGGKWENPSTGEKIPYLSIPRDALKAAQQYVIEFGQPKPAKTTPLGGDSAIRITEGTRSNNYTPVHILATPDEQAAMGRGAPMYQRTPSEEDEYQASQAPRREAASDRRDASRRSGTIRAISQRDPNARRALLDRANQNLPAHLQVMPEEVGLPGRQVRNKIRSVESLNRLSMQTAMPGEFLDTPQGLFYVGKNGELAPMLRDDRGRVIPDADRMSEQDFTDNYTGQQRRTVSQMILSGGNNNYSAEQRKIIKSRSMISSSEDYSDSEKSNALADLKIRETSLHHRYLQEQGPADAAPERLGQIPEFSAREMEEQVKIENAAIANQRARIALEQELRDHIGNPGGDKGLTTVDTSGPATAALAAPPAAALAAPPAAAPPDNPVEVGVKFAEELGRSHRNKPGITVAILNDAIEKFMTQTRVEDRNQRRDMKVLMIEAYKKENPELFNRQN